MATLLRLAGGLGCEVPDLSRRNSGNEVSMLVVLFRSKLVSTARSGGYSEMADEMDQLARTMPGFIDLKAFTAEDGERLTVVWWHDEETLRTWRDAARHRVAQRLGREQWYEYYKVDVAEIVRRKEFARTPQASD